MRNRVSKIDLRGISRVKECPFMGNRRVRCATSYEQDPDPCNQYVCECVECNPAPQSRRDTNEQHHKSTFTIKHAQPTVQSEKTFNYLMYSQKLGTITDSPWQRASGSSLSDARKKVGDDLVHDPGMPEMVLLPSEVQAGELRAEMMDQKHEDLVVTLVYKAIYSSNEGGIYVESLRHSQVIGRVHELRAQCTGSIKIMMVYSEETHQLFGWNDIPISEEPRMPKYDQEYERKRTAYRHPASGI